MAPSLPADVLDDTIGSSIRNEPDGVCDTCVSRTAALSTDFGDPDRVRRETQEYETRKPSACLGISALVWRSKK